MKNSVSCTELMWIDSGIENGLIPSSKWIDPGIRINESGIKMDWFRNQNGLISGMGWLMILIPKSEWLILESKWIDSCNQSLDSSWNQNGLIPRIKVCNQTGIKMDWFQESQSWNQPGIKMDWFWSQIGLILESKLIDAGIKMGWFRNQIGLIPWIKVWNQSGIKLD